ncbi:MAG: hypothetical protein ACD_73C00548G0001 [uncultured bacterium]|nr:MAG: hypothetical protein ACD_73C00548G0001 [uncultured bacterium]
MKKLFLICLLMGACTPGLTLNDPSGLPNQSDTDLNQSSDPQTKESAPEVEEYLVSPDFLVINEILYDATGDEQDGNTFIELYGTPLANLIGYSIQIMDGATQKNTKTIQLSEKNTLDEQGLFVICDSSTGMSTSSHIANCSFITNFDLQNGPDGLILLNQQGEVIDQLCYGFDQTNTALNNFCEATITLKANAGLSLSRNDKSEFVVNEQPSSGSFSVQQSAIEEINQNISPENPESGKKIIISEVITDPQQDWNDSSGGNGVPFDAISGNGTIGTTDEWIELKNISGDVVDLTFWSVNFHDGSDETFFFSESTDEILFSDSGSVDSFNSQETLVITDPPGDMKNVITIELFGEEQNLVDSVSIVDGNALSADDEANVIDVDGNISKNRATILF